MKPNDKRTWQSSITSLRRTLLARRRRGVTDRAEAQIGHVITVEKAMPCGALMLQCLVVLGTWLVFRHIASAFRAPYSRPQREIPLCAVHRVAQPTRLRLRRPHIIIISRLRCDHHVQNLRRGRRSSDWRYIPGIRCQKSAISYPRQPWQERARRRRHAKLSSQRAAEPFAWQRLCTSS